MSDRPKIVCLCGSTRFADAFIKAQREETLAGKIVLSVGLFGHQEGIDMAGPVKRMLDELHLRKIDLADEVLILNVETPVCDGCNKPVKYDPKWGGHSCHACQSRQSTCRVVAYIGESTRKEIAYATQKGKAIRYLEVPND